MNLTEYPIASIKAEDIQKIAQTESGIKTVDGKSVILMHTKANEPPTGFTGKA